MPSTAALSHLRVIDLTRVRAGPTCVKQFADWGADVIKIEMPVSEGEDGFGPREGSDFQNLHRNKRSLTLNLKDPRGVEVLLRLVKKADIGIFASSCEACPNIAIEYMAAGIPIASSHDGPMPEVLGEAAVYFDPEDRKTIEAALIDLIQSPDLRSKKATKAFDRAHDFTWAECADLTFAVLTNDSGGGRAPAKAKPR